ncbi:hypothetical protein Hdeb2414_s0007g00226891 [Helianthus debilis subsp. tardiflorus]
MYIGRKAKGKKRPCVSASTATTGRKAQVKGKRPCVVGNPSTGYVHHSYMLEEEELDIEPNLFWFQKPGVVSAYRASGPEEGEEEPPGSPYFMNLSDYESDHANTV